MRRKTTLVDIFFDFLRFAVKEAKKDLDQRARDQQEKERSQKLRDESIDAEFKRLE